MVAVHKLIGMAAAALMALPAAAAELVMIQQPGCHWCERWNTEIAPVYPKTAEGRFAPLRRVELRDLPGDIDLDRRVSYTPTFLVVEGGREVARLEGYPGEHFFWPLLAELLTGHAGWRPENGAETGPAPGGDG